MQTLRFYNVRAGGLTVIKKDEKTGERIPGVQFEIRKMDGEIVGTFTTDENGVVYQKTVGALCRGDEKGIGNQYVSQDKCIINASCSETHHLIRRLTPLECERLQGFPDGWTDIPGASDSARYKSLGNSVAIPCVEFIMSRIAAAMRVA